MKFKDMDDFKDPLEFEAYLLALFAHRLDSTIDIETAERRAVACLTRIYAEEDDPGFNAILQLADEISAEKGTTH